MLYIVETATNFENTTFIRRKLAINIFQHLRSTGQPFTLVCTTPFGHCLFLTCFRTSLLLSMFSYLPGGVHFRMQRLETSRTILYHSVFHTFQVLDIVLEFFNAILAAPRLASESTCPFPGPNCCLLGYISFCGLFIIL